ncbi:uncharacterized protein LOC108666333 [Hyalella azteca]|uniref:Uncharacterized protein LOC108666333 n=1 Tax=Hyalella azteca TaxID=294128 RepID=A0A8B7N483_HYAAZ|nr:uncharacterized protein LOC108666333 [Hyalella azteca]
MARLVFICLACYLWILFPSTESTLSSAVKDADESKSTLQASIDFLIPSEAFKLSPEMKKKLNKKKLLIKTEAAKYIALKLAKLLEVAAAVEWGSLLKSQAMHLATKSYNLFPDQTAAAIQWAFHTPNRDSYYKVFGKSQLPNSFFCPRQANETLACAIKIAGSSFSNIFSFFL